jgi:subtilisin-like proprotein convertase family protein
VLHNRAGGSTHNLDRQYDATNTPDLAAFVGKRCDGTWTIRVEDRAAADSGTLVQIGLQLSLPATVNRNVVREVVRGRNGSHAKKNGKARSKGIVKRRAEFVRPSAS